MSPGEMAALWLRRAERAWAEGDWDALATCAANVQEWARQAHGRETTVERFVAEQRRASLRVVK